MDTHTDFVTWLEQIQSERHWSQSELARRGGFTPTAPEQDSASRTAARRRYLQGYRTGLGHA